MKKLTALFLIPALALALSLTACGGSVGENSNRVEAAGTPEALNGEIGGEITVSAFESLTQRPFLEEAARLFEEQYPGTKVNIETFSDMPEIKTAEQGNMRMQAVQMQEDPSARSDYISRVNTALMSGTGADILAADVLPMYQFAESGQLMDLGALMEADPDFDLSAYRTNIWEALRYKGSLWYLPLDYAFDYFTYDRSLIRESDVDFGPSSAWSSTELLDLAAPLFDGSAKIFNQSGYSRAGGSSMGMTSGVFARLLKEQYSSLIDLANRQAYFTNGLFTQMLESVKTYERLGYINESVSAQMDAGSMMRGNGPSLPTERFFFKPKNNFSLQQEFTRDLGQRTNVMMMTAGGGSLQGIEDDDAIAGIEADAKGQTPFTFQYGYAMNAASKNQQTAWAFLKFLLSEEMQLSTNLNMLSLPLHNEARAQKAELVLTGAFAGLGAEGGGAPGVMALDDAQREALRLCREATEQLSDQINSYTIRDNTIDAMIQAEVQYFFDGVKSADEVATALQNKVELYLNE
ncbi:MAG: extracellular solute-binding protein [Clostridiales bacterium]|nr:extracellular solute-binding protein [Clostridiales bacterium]